jgi:nicotinamide-nucleotide amidase
MKAELISIGDEILIGQIVNTNTVWIAQQLNFNGISVAHMCTVADEGRAIVDALATAEKRAQVVIITGGLGPTRDDITKKMLCEFAGRELEMNEEVLKDVQERFAKRGRNLNELNRLQAMVPSGARVIRNAHGTAPGIWIQKNNVHFFSLPGVPYEMKPMVTDFIIPEIKKLYKLPVIAHRTILTLGIGESDLAILIEKWEDQLAGKNVKLAYLPQFGQVRLRLSASGPDKGQLDNLLENEIGSLRALIGKYIYGYENYGEESPGVVKILSDLLRERKKTVALAESCTGGHLSAQITAIPGSSDIFRGAIVPYTNTAKHHLLHVDRRIFEEKGAVSEECVVALAKSVREKFGSDYGIGISGIAGPTGGTELKPVGTVWIAVAGEEAVVARKFRFGDNRQHNIVMSANSAADLLRKFVLEGPSFTH